MKIIQGVSALASEHRPSAVAIGNFDGVHRGHQHIVKTLLAQAQARGIRPTVVTFEPLAREYFAPGSVPRLTTLKEKADLLFALGVEQVLSIEFNEALSAMSAEHFMQTVLTDGLGAQFLSVGDDFRFGYQRRGDFEMLQAFGTTHGFDVERHGTLTEQGVRISSGRVRDALGVGNLALATQLLGREFAVSGEVAEGQRLGRTIGFPTANIELADRVMPINGVFVVLVEVEGFTQELKGVANVGYRPTVNGSVQRLEVHLFDFGETIYGRTINVKFIHKVRDERKFDSLDELREQIGMDAEVARAFPID